MNKNPDYSSIEQLWKSLVEPADYDAAEHLWKMLPGVYRERDEPHQDVTRQKGDLKLYLEALAVILDQIKGNLDQRLRDTSPLTCQKWLLPYFADMLDVRPLSPDIEGQRQEIANAIRWRQRKGTVAACVEIAEAVGQMPIIAYEGHNSVATTAQPGYRQPTMEELGEPSWQDKPKIPSYTAARPGTPAVTVDFRKPSFPTKVEEHKPTPLSVKSHFGNEEVVWQRENAPHGVPCHSENGYRDVSMRTVDMRTPNWREGHHHPKRLRLYTSIPEGFIQAEVGVGINKNAVELVMMPMDPPDNPSAWKQSTAKDGYQFYCCADVNTHLITVGRFGPENFEYVCIEERHLPALANKNDNISHDLIIRRTLVSKRLHQPVSGWQLPEKWNEAWQENDYLLQWERRFVPKQNEKGEWHTSIRGGTWNITEGKPGNAGASLTGRKHLKVERRWPTLLNKLVIDRPENNYSHIVEAKQLVLPNEFSVHAEFIMLSKIAANNLQLNVESYTLPPTSQLRLKPAHLKATDSLIQNIEAIDLVVELEYCTVNSDWHCDELRASDSILLGDLTKTNTLRLRYSCAPQLKKNNMPDHWRIHNRSVNTYPPELHHQMIDGSGYHKLDESEFDQHGYGVLHQGVHPAIRYGAEDGGELGAYHHRHYCSRQDAITAKLIEYLPVGIKPVLIVDQHWQPPIEQPKQ
ncbi:phage tail protein [Pseudomonadota bacterium]